MGRLAELRAMSQKVRNVGGNSGYNYAPQWYMKPDKEIYLLDGSPRARTYYQQKGFLWLDPDAVEEWLGNPDKGIVSDRLRVIGEQRRKAQLIDQIRLIEGMHPTAKISARLSKLSNEQLEKVVETLRTKYGEIVDIWDEKALGLEDAAYEEAIQREQEMLAGMTDTGDPAQLAAAVYKSKQKHRPLMGGNPTEAF